ncbi:MAG: hypothetical protein ED557_10885 [Balneola sp.]|nr:MAG: hypothetical protein ED557_10885 [Balneola sp.]
MIRYLLSILLVFVFQHFGMAQDKYHARLPVKGYVTELGLSPLGEIWMASKAGNVYYTKEFGDLWHIGPFGSLDPLAFDSGKNFERINFLSENVLIISGFIQENGKQNFIYRSEDGGKSWDKVIFGMESSWIDATYFKHNGKGWMSGGSQLIYYTEDYGLTWSAKPKIENMANRRIMSIHFSNDEKIGLFASNWNTIHRTFDNAETWEILETPLYQKKYRVVSNDSKPRIDKIRILGDYYLVSQQQRVFITQNNDINWTPLPDIIDFEVSDNQGFLITRDYNVKVLDENLTPTWTSERTLLNPPKALNVIDSTLYVYAGDEIFQIVNQRIKSSPLVTNNIPIPEPYTKVDFKGETYGFSGVDILKLENKRWARINETQFPIGNASVFNGKLVIADQTLENRVELNTETNEFIKYDLPDKIFPQDLELKSLTIGYGSLGCFHYDDQTRIYNLNGSFLELSKSDRSFLNSMPRILNHKLVKEIISEANQARLDELSVDDLLLKPSIISDYKDFISQKEEEIKENGIDQFDFENPYQFPGENTDFSFYKSVADSIESIDDSVINDVFSIGYGNWSTTQIWHQLIFDFKNGSKLIISNSDDIPNYLYTPWVINYNGLEYKTNSFALGRLINKLTKGKFYEDYADDPEYALFKISDYLYKKKLSFEN